MLQDTSDEIRACYEHAEFCHRKAAAEPDCQLKQDYLDLEQRWLTLARSYELRDRITDFGAEHWRNSGKSE